MVLNTALTSATAQQEPVTNKNHLALNHFSDISSVICLHAFASGFTFSPSQGQSFNGLFANTLSSKSAVRFTKIHKIYYGVVKLLLRDEVVVKPSKLILCQPSTCE